MEGMRRAGIFLLVVAVSAPLFAYSATMSEAVLAKFTEQEKYYQLPEGVLAKIARIESNGNVMATNKSSSASGMFQWLRDSWLFASKSLYGQPKDLQSRFNPFIATEVTAFSLAQVKAQNGALIQAAKADLSVGLYMGHFLGPAGARKFFTLLAQNPNDSAARWFPKEGGANGSVFAGKTLAGVYNYFASKMQQPGITGVSNYTGTYDEKFGSRILDSAGVSALARPYTGTMPTSDSERSYTSTYTASDASANPTLNTATALPVAAQSASLIIAQSSRVSRGQTTLISWTSVHMKAGSCKISSDGTILGTSTEGSRNLPRDLTQQVGDITITFTCTSETGTEKETNVIISVE